MPPEVLARYAGDASLEVIQQLGSMLHHIEMGEAHLGMMVAPWAANPENERLTELAEAYFRHALSDAQRCIDLLSTKAPPIEDRDAWDRSMAWLDQHRLTQALLQGVVLTLLGLAMFVVGKWALFWFVAHQPSR